MEIKVLGFTGPAGAGKGECIKYISEKLHLKEWQIFKHSLSDELRSIANQRNIDLERSNLRDIANDLRRKFGNGILSTIISRQIREEIKKTVFNKVACFVDSIRNPEEVNELKKNWGNNFFLIGVTAPIEVLINRIQQRNRSDENVRALDNSEHAEDMLHRELGKDEPLFGHNISECLKKSNFLINNVNSIQKLHSELDTIIYYLLQAN